MPTGLGNRLLSFQCAQRLVYAASDEPASERSEKVATAIPTPEPSPTPEPTPTMAPTPTPTQPPAQSTPTWRGLSGRAREQVLLLRCRRIPLFAVSRTTHRQCPGRDLWPLHGDLVRQHPGNGHRAHRRPLRGPRQRPLCRRPRHLVGVRIRPAEPHAGVAQRQQAPKNDNDAAEWLPDLNQCWYVDRTIKVRLEYALSIDHAEADAIDRVLATCESTEMVMLTDGGSRTAAGTARPRPPRTLT